MSIQPYLIFIIINVAIFAAPYLLQMDNYQFLSLGWKDNLAIQNGQWYRLVTSIFLHGDLFHLLFNMYSLYQLGPFFTQVFDRYTNNVNLAFLVVFLVSGICGSLLSYFFNLSPSLGASGAIFGLIGALTMFSILNNQTYLLQNFVSIIAINLFIGFTDSRIDYFGHIGGLLSGMGLGWLILVLKFL